MSEQLTKEALVRLAWITELRRQGERQCGGGRRGDKVCALELLQEIVGAEVRDPESHAGLSGYQSAQVAQMNDGRYGWPVEPRRTFSEIADVVEGWF